MYNAMPTLPVSDLRNRQSEIIEQLDETPVLLTRGGYGAGVLVHPEKWNQMVQEMARLQRLVRFERILAEMKAGDYSETLE
jgi:PHD/YefM family antitoxin component YafN of YafNO toxin-antitoxin module